MTVVTNGRDLQPMQLGYRNYNVGSNGRFEAPWAEANAATNRPC
jgi:hypothetical protein